MVRASARDELQFIQSMLRELHEMRRASGKDELLAYLIEMAYLEASDQLRALHAAQQSNGQLAKAA